jgi:hypothetical protein
VDQEHERDRHPVVELGEDHRQRTNVGIHSFPPNGAHIIAARGAPLRRSVPAAQRPASNGFAPSKVVEPIAGVIAVRSTPSTIVVGITQAGCAGLRQAGRSVRTSEAYKH